MGPDADLCTRCGYAVPLDRARCLACSRRIRHRPAGVVTGPARTGAAAADAWAVWSATVPDRSPAPEFGDLRRYRDPTSRAVRLVEALRAARLCFAVLAVIAGARLGFAVAADDAAELADLGWWDTFETATTATALVVGGVLLVVAVLGLQWGQAALANLDALALHLHAPPANRFRAVVMGAAAAIVAGTVGWQDHALGDERVSALVALAVGAVGFTLATALRPAVAAVTLVERQRAELVARIEAATGRHRDRHGFVRP